MIVQTFKYFHVLSEDSLLSFISCPLNLFSIFFPTCPSYNKVGCVFWDSPKTRKTARSQPPMSGKQVETEIHGHF